MFCFILVVNLNDTYFCYHPPGRHLTCLWSFQAPPPATSCIPHGRPPMHSWSFWAPPNASVVLSDAVPCALGVYGHCPTCPWSFQATSYAILWSPYRCRPTHPWSFRVPPHAPLVLPGTASCAIGPSRRCPTYVKERRRNLVAANKDPRNSRAHEAYTCNDGTLNCVCAATTETAVSLQELIVAFLSDPGRRLTVALIQCHIT